MLLLDGQAVASKALLFDHDDDQGLRYLRPRFWERITKEGIQDWKMGCFSYTEEAPTELFGHGVLLNWQAAGVEFFWPEIQNILKLEELNLIQRSVNMGALPPGASANDRKHAGLAHQAAGLIRTEGIKKPKAIRRVVETSPNDLKEMRKLDSIERAVRDAYDLMYDDEGIPLKIDPD